MRAIVTGGAGFIGSNLCQHLSEIEKCDFAIIDDLSTGTMLNVFPGHDITKRSLEEPNFVLDFVNNFAPDVIFHLAAVPRVSYSVEYPLHTALKNTLATVALLDGVRLSKYPKCRIINSSSSSIYGGADVLPTPESYPANPKSPYALEKWHAEEWCKMFAKLYDMDVVSLRYFNVIGPRSRFGGPYSTVLSGWLHSIYAGTNAYIEGIGTQSRDFCDVFNVVQANIKAAKCSKKFAGESFNIAQGSQHSLLQVKELIETITGKTLNLEFRPPRKGDVQHTLADISAAKSVLGYDPDLDFEKQVKRMADWYKDTYSNV